MYLAASSVPTPDPTPEDDFDDRPRKRGRSSGGGGSGPLDNMYTNTNIVVLVLFGCCCGIIAFVLSLVAYLIGKDEKAKSNAMIVMIVSGIMFVLNLIAALTGQLNQVGGR
ncbi:MAG: hypothetical protein K2P78_09320 [Gemmataceae bacterium]|nr:hypothetical protein [Gemmataceae bacterium]